MNQASDGVTLDLTDERIEHLLQVPKHVENPKAHYRTRQGHRQRTFEITSSEGERFRLFVRERLGTLHDYSCGLLWIPRGGGGLVTLCRYNGPSHVHGGIEFHAHIHRASQSAIDVGKKPEHIAEETERYDSCAGALRCLVLDCNISGLDVSSEDQSTLPFDD